MMFIKSTNQQIKIKIKVEKYVNFSFFLFPKIHKHNKTESNLVSI